MVYLIIGMVAFLACTLWSRFVNEKALGFLDTTQKGQLVEAFSKDRKRSIFILGAIILIFLAGSRMISIDPIWATFIYFGAIGVYFVVTALITNKRIQSLNFPESYMKSHRLASILRFLGFVLLIVFLTLFLYENQPSLHRLF